MAKTIMVSNEVYEKLKKAKGEHSFSELMKELMERKVKGMTGKDILKFAGAYEGDTEYDEIMKWARKGWDKWNKRYA